MRRAATGKESCLEKNLEGKCTEQKRRSKRRSPRRIRRKKNETDLEDFVTPAVNTIRSQSKNLSSEMELSE